MIKRILNKADRVKNDILSQVAPSRSRFAKNDGNTVFMYHGIDSNGSNRFNTRHTSKSDFEKQIIYLKKTSNILSLEDYFIGNFDSSKPNVAITFDDGYLNNLTNALPILEKHQVPATVFITGINETNEDFLWADFVDIMHKCQDEDFVLEGITFTKKNGIFSTVQNESIYSVVKTKYATYDFKKQLYAKCPRVIEFMQRSENFEYWKLLTDSQIKELSKSTYITIGSHGFYHNNLNEIPLQSAIKELERSKSYLENVTQYEVNSIGYPDGGYTSEVLDAAEKIGFNYQLATDYYKNPTEDSTDKRILNRKGIYNCDTWANQLV